MISAQARLAEQIALGVHRLADAVGVEHDDVADVEVDPLLLEQLVEFLRRARNTQTDHHAVGDQDLRATRRRDEGPGRKISGVWPARQ